MQPDAITVTAAVQDAEEMLEILSIYPEHLNPTNLSGLKTNLGFSRDIRENLGFLTKSSCFAPKPSIAMSGAPYSFSPADLSNFPWSTHFSQYVKSFNTLVRKSSGP